MSNATNIRQFNGTFPQPTWPSTRVASLSVNAFGIVTTSLSMAVFANPSLKDQVYKYLLVASIVDWSYLVLFIAITLSIPICGDSPLLCGSEAQYVQKMYTLWASDYLTSCLALYSILNEIFLSFQRLLILRKNMLMKNWKFWQVGPVMGLISLLVYFPILLVKSVQRTGYIQYQGVVYAVYSTLSTSGAAEVNIVQAFLRGILVTVVMTILNAATLYNFRSFIKRKAKISQSTTRAKSVMGNSIQRSQTGQELTSRMDQKSQTGGGTSTNRSSSKRAEASEYNANRNITIMLISTSTLYITGTMPYMIFLLLRYLSTVQMPSLYVSLVYIFLLVLVSLKFFVYYFCNKFFRQVFNSYAKCLFSCFLKPFIR